MAQSEPRTAIVTGAARRVGAVIADSLAANGWTVIAHVHHENDTVPGELHRVVADLSDPGAATRILAAADPLPPVALLVNNAARFAWDEAGRLDCDEFDVHMAINVRAPALLIDALAQQHRPGRDACVVNILDSKLAAPNPDYLSYTLSKQALGGLTEIYARALAGIGIRVNAVAPALMLQSSGQSEENYRRMHDMNPLRRGVEPRDVVDAIQYLADARAVTGQTIVLDGGQRFMALNRDVQFLEDE
jgi:NAD(P)-dependent dehydrogenase (short-subunit alcohol dehydrogenase family)